MKQLKLNDSLSVAVDDVDYDELSNHKWCVQEDTRGRGGKGFRQYVVRTARKDDGSTETIYMHKVILERLSSRATGLTPLAPGMIDMRRITVNSKFALRPKRAT